MARAGLGICTVSTTRAVLSSSDGTARMLGYGDADATIGLDLAGNVFIDGERVRGDASGRRRSESRVDGNAVEAARREPHRRASRGPHRNGRPRRGSPRDPRRRRDRAPAPGRIGAPQRTHGVARRGARRSGARAEQPARRDNGILATAPSQALAARGPHRARGDSPRSAPLGDDREGPAGDWLGDAGSSVALRPTSTSWSRTSCGRVATRSRPRGSSASSSSDRCRRCAATARSSSR